MRRIGFQRGCLWLALSLTVSCAFADAQLSQDQVVRMLYAQWQIPFEAEVRFGPGTARIKSVSVTSTRVNALPKPQRLVHSLSAYKNAFEAAYQMENLNNKALNVAGRPTLAVKLTPRDGWRYTQVLWLDRERGLILKSEHTRGLEIIGTMETLKVRYPQQADPAQDPAQQTLEAQAQQADAQGLDRPQNAFTIKNLPTGFFLESVQIESTRAQQIYSDGIARISVFAQASGQLPGYGERQRGSTSFISKRSGAVDLIAVGEVPAATLERFLSGVDAN